MEYSGPVPHSVLEKDLVMSEEDDQDNDHWPGLPRSAGTRPLLALGTRDSPSSPQPCNRLYS
ncbi:hypothetical protein E2C01_047172 [Portunus trituberculatus]|uniref:Uncharacterized protein n=1 Tax=Portunus trituberculatus TaxID=210409 RepID=A0A5B7G7T6_PORTR|nr:hypothetical protein [Portunus trituberculatus]